MRLITASIDAWQPAVNTTLLIILTVVGRKELKRHGKRISRSERREKDRVRRFEQTMEETRDVVRRVEAFLDESGPEYDHLR